MSAAQPPVPPCPSCGGPWLNGWRWQHHPAACELVRSLDTTQAADAERMASTNTTYWRTPSTAEIALHQAVTGRPPGLTTAVVPYATGINAVFINNSPSAALSIH